MVLQAGGPAGGGALPDAFLIGYLIVLGIMGIGYYAIQIVVLTTLSRCLNRCSLRNRTMEPGMVWLNLIPCFNLVWYFITIIRIEESLEAEFYDRGMPRRDNYGKPIGITYMVLKIVGISICSPAIIASLVCLIIYWVKIAGFSKELAEGPSFRDEYDNDDEDDRRDRRRRNRDDRDERDERDEDDRRRSRRRNDDDDRRDDDVSDEKPWRRS